MKKRIYIILCVCSLISFFILHFSFSFILRDDLPLIRLNLLSAGYYSYKLVPTSNVKIWPKENTGGLGTAYLVYQSKNDQDIYIGYIWNCWNFGLFVPKECEFAPNIQIIMDVLIFMTDAFLKYIMLILSFIFLLRVIFGTWGEIKLKGAKGRDVRNEKNNKDDANSSGMK